MIPPLVSNVRTSLYQLPTLRYLFYVMFTYSYFTICPVVGMIQSLPGANVNSTNSTVPGVGFQIWGLWGPEAPESWQCGRLYNEALEETSEFDKAGSSSASTIMALLPALMAFAPVVTADIGFLCHLSTLQGFIAAGFTFGLPVRQLDTWKLAVIKVKNLLGELESRNDNTATVLKSSTEMVDILLSPIKDTALLPRRPRRIWVSSLRFFFNFAQSGLIYSLLTSVPAVDSFYLLWLCPEWGGIIFGMWQVAIFTFMGCLRARFESGSFEGDEVIYISKVSTSLRTCFNSALRQRFLDPHPMIVILRPSNNTREREPCWANPSLLHVDYFIGILQLFWICFLSFLFSSTIGGTLFRTLAMVAVFIAIVGASRGVSILVCWLAQKYLDLRVIEYDNLEERRMIQRLLGGLTGVLVDIRWINYKKPRWQESIKMYLWGHQLSCRNVVGGPDDTEQCTLHTQIQRSDAFRDWFLRLSGFIFLTWLSIGSPWRFQRDPGPIVDFRVQQAITITAFVAVILSFLCLGRTRRLLIRNF